jgi:tetraacyldisaccharide 4'-kinase
MVTPVSAMSARFHDLVSGRAAGIGPAVLRLGLSAASLPYAWAVGLRNRGYDRGWIGAYRSPVPVISVGNLTVGGTGKTPCVEYLARYFHDQGTRVAILSRGYGSLHGPNDEAQVLAENLPGIPHLQSADRAATAREAVETHGAQLLILDDGFQHRRMVRDLDIVLVDATNPWGHNRLMPRGLLREPLASLRRAAVVILSRADQVAVATLEAIEKRIRRECGDVLIVKAMHQPQCWVQHEQADQPLAALRGQSVAAFCGVGNPASFRRTLEDLGCRVTAFRAFPDHHHYSRSDVVKLIDWVRADSADCAATTQKDLVKLRSATVGGRALFALRIGLSLQSSLESKRLHERLHRLTAA